MKVSKNLNLCMCFVRLLIYLLDLPGWNNDGDDDVDDHLSHGAEVAGSVVGDAASLATEVGE